jgi:hypothetical protein
MLKARDILIIEYGMDIGGTIEFGHGSTGYTIIGCKMTDGVRHYPTNHEIVLEIELKGNWAILEALDLGSYKPKQTE